MKPLFDLFDGHIRKSSFEAKKGQIVDASIAKVPIQRNKRDENRKIKDGEPPEDWPDNKRPQKDTDARWTKKNGKSSFGYKNHIEIDSQNKIIRKYSVTEASVHDSNVFTAARTSMPTQLIGAMRKSPGLKNKATDRRSNEKDTEANPSRGGKDRVTEQDPKSEAGWSTYSEPKP